ncbi:response regulator [Stutzerimonas stutzeri]|nr:response regulator [Stutzerimonas stutzeri]
MAGGTAEAKRILLGMRDSAERRELATRLTVEGYHVGHCTDQADLAQRIDATVEVVILADELAAMPLDEVGAALEKLPAGSAIPFILLSRDAEHHAALKARLPSTINDFVVLDEPVGPASLLSCLATCMRLRQHQRAYHTEATERADQRTRFERLIENLPIGVCFIDADGNTLLSNPKYDEYVPNRKIPSTAPERARRWVGLDSHGQVIPPKVLLVEDDNAVRPLLQSALEDFGYHVHVAADSQRALELAAELDSLDLLLTDVGLPGLNGRQLAEMLQQRRPGLPVVLITGYAEQAATRLDCLAPGMRLMTKPFTLELLAETVTDALAAPVD